MPELDSYVAIKEAKAYLPIVKLERAVIDAAIKYHALPVSEKTLNETARELESAVSALIAAREKQL